jgi:hypothetical protein
MVACQKGASNWTWQTNRREERKSFHLPDGMDDCTLSAWCANLHNDISHHDESFVGAIGEPGWGRGWKWGYIKGRKVLIQDTEMMTNEGRIIHWGSTEH